MNEEARAQLIATNEAKETAKESRIPSPIANAVEAMKKPKILVRDRELVFVDVETTGLDPEKHEIIELAAVRLSSLNSGLHEKARFSVKIKPKRPEHAQPKALEVNGYTAERWRDAVDSVHVAISGLVCVCSEGKPTIAGHNVAKFDLPFITAAAKLSGRDFEKILDHHVFDTASLAWSLAIAHNLESVSLETLCAQFGISNDGAHGAMRDVERAIAVYKHCVGFDVERAMRAELETQVAT